MIRFVLAAAVTTIASQVADTQAAEPLPLVRTCTIAAPAEKDQPRLYLVDSTNGRKTTTYLQINGSTRLSGPQDAITISVEPFDATVTVKGWAPEKDATYFRAIVTEGWTSLLDRIRRGEKLTLSAGSETIAIPLAGSGLAVAALQRCTE